MQLLLAVFMNCDQAPAQWNLHSGVIEGMGPNMKPATSGGEARRGGQIHRHGLIQQCVPSPRLLAVHT